MRATIDCLQRAGAEVECAYAEQLWDLAQLPRAEVVLYKSRSPFWSSLAGALEAQGSLVINSFEATQRTQDKLLAMAYLTRGGLPVPPTWTTLCPKHVGELVGRHPLLLKPRLGQRGEGVRWFGHPHDVDELNLAETSPVIQEALRPVGPEIKAYGIGKRVYSFEKEFTPVSWMRPGGPIELDPKLESLVVRVGEVLGLDLFGVDVLPVESGYQVIDVNVFPGFRGIPEAPQRICELVLERLAGR